MIKMKVTQAALNVSSSNDDLVISSSFSEKKLEEGLGAITIDEPLAPSKEENRDEGDNIMSLESFPADDNVRASNDGDRDNCDGDDGDIDGAELNQTPVQSFGDYMVQGTIDLVRSVSSTLSFTSRSSKLKTAVDESKANMAGPEEIKEHTAEVEEDAVQGVNGDIPLAQSMSAISFGSTSFKSGEKDEVTTNEVDPDVNSAVKEDDKDVEDILDEGIKTVPSTSSAISFGSFLAKKKKD